MDKKIWISSLILIGLVMAALVSASTFSMSPTNVSVTEGKTFNVSVFVDPQGSQNYTVKLELKYSPDILEVKSFNFGGNWMPLSQSGYDLVDNTNGTLIKTGGYPGGLNSKAVFGTITFKAKKTGSETIQIIANSLALNADNQNVVSELPVKASVSVSKSVPVSTQTKPKAETVISSSSEQTEVEQSEIVQSTSTENKSLFSATIVNIQITLGEILISLAILLIGFVVLRFRTAKKNI